MFFLLIFIIYPVGCFYIGWRFLDWAKSFIQLSGIVFWPVWTILAATPILPRLAARTGIRWPEPGAVGDWVLAVVYMAVILWLLSDLARLISNSWSVIPEVVKTIRFQGSLVTALLICILGYGSWNATNPVVVRYELTIDKHISGLDSIKAVLVSDIHAGRVVGAKRIEQLATALISLNPDIVFYAGDIIDNDADYADKNNLLLPLANVKPKLGSYAVLGNHEYIGGQGGAAEALLRKTGMHVLRDDKILIRDMIYVVGRDDRSAGVYRNAVRKPLRELMQDVNKTLPVILLDHQPNSLQEAVENEIDLQVSGHTHKGQFFPNNLIVERMYEQAWGYLSKGGLQLIVSSGYGTWGPPIRIGSRAEIVELTIHFKNP